MMLSDDSFLNILIERIDKLHKLQFDETSFSVFKIKEEDLKSIKLEEENDALLFTLKNFKSYVFVVYNAKLNPDENLSVTFEYKLLYDKRTNEKNIEKRFVKLKSKIEDRLGRAVEYYMYSNILDTIKHIHYTKKDEN